MTGRRRSIAEDSLRLVARMIPPPRFEGLRAVPPREPFLLVANHFQAPDLWVGWVAAAISAAVASVREPGSRDLHWLVLSQWRWFELGDIWVPNPLSALLFPRACAVWGLIPTPPRPSDLLGRATALRRVLEYLGYRQPPGAPRAAVGLFPEGRASTALVEAKPGSGAFLHRVSTAGIPLLPAGAYLDERTLVVRFGEPFSLEGAPAENLDTWARTKVMVSIGRLLPRDLWGAYYEATEEGVGGPSG
ncbi:MAG: hypothetical protein ACM3US_05945 [Sphingomonadaceae bacterium]